MAEQREPMSDEQLAAICKRVEEEFERQWLTTYGGSLEPTIAYIRKLRQENAAMREIVRAVADIRPLRNRWPWGKYAQCPFFCSGDVPVPENCDWPEHVDHDDAECPVVKALELVARWDAATAEPESEVSE